MSRPEHIDRRRWRAAVRQSRLPNGVKVTALRHAESSHHHFHDDPANLHAIRQDRLAADTGKDPDSIRRHTNALVERGWLVLHQRGHRGQQAVYHYALPGVDVTCEACELRYVQQPRKPRIPGPRKPRKSEVESPVRTRGFPGEESPVVWGGLVVPTDDSPSGGPLPGRASAAPTDSDPHPGADDDHDGVRSVAAPLPVNHGAAAAPVDTSRIDTVSQTSGTSLGDLFREIGDGLDADPSASGYLASHNGALHGHDLVAAALAALDADPDVPDPRTFLATALRAARTPRGRAVRLTGVLDQRRPQTTTTPDPWVVDTPEEIHDAR